MDRERGAGGGEGVPVSSTPDGLAAKPSSFRRAVEAVLSCQDTASLTADEKKKKKYQVKCSRDCKKQKTK